MLAAVMSDSLCAPYVHGQGPIEPAHCIFPEQRRIAYRHPEALGQIPIPGDPRPPTVRDFQADRPEYLLSLDEAIGVALANAEVIRVLTGFSASSTGQTIYDPAIINTQIDQARARFDPNLRLRQSDWSRNERPGFFPNTPVIGGVAEQVYNLDLGVSQTKTHGGTASLGVTANPIRRDVPGLVVNPLTTSALTFSFDQPLLRGAGRRVNLAPIVIARIDTERSYFQLKDSVQEMVRSVIQGYWGLVFARTQLWARQQQTAQAEYAYDFLSAGVKAGRRDIGDTAQAAVSLANFRASLISAQGELLDREAAFRNVLGLPPVGEQHFVPATAPQQDRVEPAWEALMATAELNRPDIIELKLIREADRQRRILSNNDALPLLDATALYRWNGLQGTTPNGATISTQGGQFTDWQLGVSFSVPLGLRSERAALRRIELILARDDANIRQQIHAISHDLAQTVRNLDQFYAQFEAFRKVREASRLNLNRIFAVFDVGGLPTEQIIYLDVLQAITDWGNAVNSEAASLTQYNSELASLERQLGTILENHAIRFFEERYGSIGPAGRCRADVCYPKAIAPGPNQPIYDVGDRPAEDSFDLQTIMPGLRRSESGELPPDATRQQRATSADRVLQPYKAPTREELMDRLKRLEAEIHAQP
jgi:outer membrane protein TolC